MKFLWWNWQKMIIFSLEGETLVTVTNSKSKGQVYGISHICHPFTQLQFEAKNFFTWKCANSRQKLSRDKTVWENFRLREKHFFRAPIEKFHTWPFSSHNQWLLWLWQIWGVVDGKTGKSKQSSIYEVFFLNLFDLFGLQNILLKSPIINYN